MAVNAKYFWIPCARLSQRAWLCDENAALLISITIRRSDGTIPFDPVNPKEQTHRAGLVHKSNTSARNSKAARFVIRGAPASASNRAYCTLTGPVNRNVVQFRVLFVHVCKGLLRNRAP